MVNVLLTKSYLFCNNRFDMIKVAFEPKTPPKKFVLYQKKSTEAKMVLRGTFLKIQRIQGYT